MGTQPLAPFGPASPNTPPGTLPEAVPSGLALPWTGPGIWPDAPSGPATSQAVPSGFTHGGGGSSAAAIGASAIVDAAAPANRMDVIVFLNIAFMKMGYHHQRSPKPQECLSKRFCQSWW